MQPSAVKGAWVVTTTNPGSAGVTLVFGDLRQPVAFHLPLRMLGGLTRSRDAAVFEEFLSDLGKAFIAGLLTGGAFVAMRGAAARTVHQYLRALWRRNRRDCTYVEGRLRAISLNKPNDQLAQVAPVKAALRLKLRHDSVSAQAADLAAWNRELERRVEDQVRELERVGRLKQFLAPQIAEMIVSGDEQFLESHRREITVVVCDLRGFTAFSETAAPEDVMVVLREYQSGLGTLVDKFEGTVELFTGDGLMVWFNDPLPCSDPCGRAARMGVEMRDCVSSLTATWRKLDRESGLPSVWRMVMRRSAESASSAGSITLRSGWW